MIHTDMTSIVLLAPVMLKRIKTSYTNQLRAKMKHHNEPEDEDNITMICKDCTEDMYPMKGKFSRESIEKADFAKLLFEDNDKPDRKREDNLIGDMNEQSWDLSDRVNDLINAEWDSPTLKKKIVEINNHLYKIKYELNNMWNKDDQPNGEHMWVKIKNVGDHSFIGELDNEPVFVGNKWKHGEEYTLEFKDIEDLHYGDFTRKEIDEFKHKLKHNEGK